MGAPKVQDAPGEIAALKRKLEALNYIEGVEGVNAYSAPLTKRLLDDVVHTTERYRSLKMQETRKSYELESERKKAELLRQENGRLLKENNELHLARMKDAEASRANERSSWLAQKKSEDELAELRFWKTQAASRFESLEKEKDGLRLQLQKQLGGDMDFTISDPLVPLTDEGAVARLPAAKLPDSGVIDLVRLSDERAATSAEQIAFLQAQQAELSELLSTAQATVQAREEEVQRLTRLLEGGRNVDDLSAEHEKKAAEELLTSLNHQVEYMTKELAAFDEVSKKKEEAEQRLQQAEARVKALTDEVAEQESQAKKLVKEVLEVHSLLGPAPASAPGESDSASADLSERMEAVKGSLRERIEELRSKMAGEKEELERLREASQKHHEQVKALKRRVGDLEKEKAASAESSQRTKDELAAAMRELTGAKNELSTKQMRIQKLGQDCKKHKEAVAKLEAECRTAKEGLEAARKETEAARRALGGRNGASGAAAQPVEQDGAATELRRRVEELERELREVDEQRRSAEALVESLKVESETLKRELAGRDEEVVQLRLEVERSAAEGAGGPAMTGTESELAAKDALLQELRLKLQEAEQRAALLAREKEALVAEMQSASANGANGDQLRELQSMLATLQEELRRRDESDPGRPTTTSGTGEGFEKPTVLDVEGTREESSLPAGSTESVQGQYGTSGLQEGDVARLKQELLAAGKQIEAVTAERDSLKGRVEELVAQVSELQWTVSALKRAAELGLQRAADSEGADADGEGGLQAAVDRLRFELGEREADLACLQEDYEVQAKKMQETMEELSQRAVTLEKTCASLATEKERAETSLEEAVAKAKEAQAECQRLQEAEAKLATDLDKVEKQYAAASKDLQDSRSEGLRLRRQLAEADLGMGTQSLQGDELQRQCVTLRQSLQAAKQREDSLETQVSELTTQRDKERSAASKVREELLEAKHQLDNAEKDEEQLKTLITQLDSTREDLVTKLRASLAAERVASKRVSSLEEEKAGVKRELDRASAEVAQLRQVIEALDRDRDHMQGEVDVRAEEISRLVQETASAQGHVADLRMQLDTAEHRLATATARATQAEEEVTRTQEHLRRQTDANGALQEECDIKAGELRSLADDLANLTREQQHLNQELVQVAEERNALQDELERVARKLEYAEQLLRARDKEHEGLLTSLQQLGEENQRLVTELQQAQHEIQHLQLHAASLEDTLQAMQDHIKGLEGEAHQQISDLQAYERQCDSLSRSLAQQAEILEELQTDKAGLQVQLDTAKQVNVELEHSRSYLQREIAGAEARVQTLQARLQDGENEKESLMARCQQVHARVRELEQLLARVRAQEHVLEVTTQDKGQKTAMLQERAHAFESQVSALQRQVDELQAIKDAQDAEIVKLQRRNGEGPRQEDLEGDHSQAGAEARWERREMEKELARLRESHTKLQEEFANTLKEKENMLGLLSKLDIERSELQQRLTGKGEETYHKEELEALKKKSVDFEERLKESEARRNSLEKDFEVLVTNMGEFSTAKGDDENARLESRFANVLADNQRLRESLAAAMAACSSTEADLQRIRQEYAALTEVLHARTGSDRFRTN